MDLGNGKIIDRIIYDEDEASYTVNINFLELTLPETNYYSIKENANGTGWYNTKVTIESSEEYEIANDEDLTFGKNAVFSDQGE